MAQEKTPVLIDKSISALIYVNCVAVIGIGAVLSLIIAVEVVFRYVLNSSLFFVEELSRVLFIWLGLLGANIALHEGAHVGFDILQKRLPDAVKRFVIPLTLIIMLVYCGYLFYGSTLVLPRQKMQMTATLGISIYWSYLSIAVGMLLMCIRLLYSLFCLVTGRGERVRSVTDMFTFE